MKNLYAFIITSVFIVSCSMEEASQETADPMTTIYFTEFLPCEAGPDYSSENMTKMIAEWQKLLTDDSLLGVWGYAPAADTNSVGDTGWWELQWTSKDSADTAWSEWVQNDAVNAWQEKYSSVLQCDGAARNSFDGIFPMASNTYGELPETGYFYAEIHICELNEGSSSQEAMDFLPGFVNAVSEADYADTSYHLGNYFSQQNEDSFLWGNFTNSKESLDKANASFEANVRDKMFPLFSEFASCGDIPDLYHGFSLYWSEDKDFMPTFPTN